MRLNKPKSQRQKTHEDADTFPQLTPEQKLRRSLTSCLLWEHEFYENGERIANRLIEVSRQIAPEKLAEIAREVRSDLNLRHAPLLLTTVLTETGAGKAGLISSTINSVIRRADELAEFVALYWRGGKRPLSSQTKKGLAKAFQKFDRCELAKYDRKASIRLRDVMFLVHPKPKDEEQALLWSDLADKKLRPADTWETALSSGADKKETFTRLLEQSKLNYLALLHNLRNMQLSGVNETLIKDAISSGQGAEYVFPFRYVAAARACPAMESVLDKALLKSVKNLTPLKGKTIVLVDASSSMDYHLSRRSDMTRMDAAAALACLLQGDIRVFTFSNELVEVPTRRGMAGIEAVIKSQPHMGTYLGAAVKEMNNLSHDRLIVITDEQDHDRVPAPKVKCAYMINVGSYENGIGYGTWVHIDGFSEQIIRFIHEYEAGIGMYGFGHT